MGLSLGLSLGPRLSQSQRIGQPLNRCPQVAHHAFNIAQHISIGDAQHRIAVLAQPGIATGIVVWPQIVGKSVHLNNEAQFAA